MKTDKMIKHRRFKDRPKTGIIVRLPDLSDLLIDYAHGYQQAHPEYEEIICLTHGKLGYVNTKRGLFTLCSEGVGDADPISDIDPHIFGVFVKKRKHGESTWEYEMIAVFDHKIGKTELLKLCIQEEVPLELFIRTFGARLERNFQIWHKILSDAA